MRTPANTWALLEPGGGNMTERITSSMRQMGGQHTPRIQSETIHQRMSAIKLKGRSGSGQRAWRWALTAIVVWLICDAAFALGIHFILTCLAGALAMHLGTLAILVTLYGGGGKHKQKKKSKGLFDVHSRVGYSLEVYMLVLSLSGCLNYVYISYHNVTYDGRTVMIRAPDDDASYIDVTFSLLFALELLFQLFTTSPFSTSSTDRPRFMATSFCDLLSVSAMYGYSNPSQELADRPLFMLLFPLRFLRLMRGYKLFKVLSRNDVVSTALLNFFLSIVSLLCTIAGLVMALEYPCEHVVPAEHAELCHDDLRQFHMSLYLTIVTVTTVGYGDITCVTTAGRVLIMTSILFTMIFIPTQVFKVVEAYKRPEDTLNLVDAREPHMCLVFVGHMEEAHMLSVVRELLQEAEYRFHAMRIVAVCQGPTSGLLQLGGGFQGRLIVLKGQATTAVLQRAGIATAQTCVVVAGQGVAGNEAAVCALLAVRGMAAPDTEVVALMSLPEYTPVAAAVGAEVTLTMGEVEMVLMAHACFAPAFSTLIANLMGTYRLPSHHPFSSLTSTWLSEYTLGMHTELYRIRLTDFEGDSFLEACAKIFQHGVVLFALEEEGKRRAKHIRIYPINRTIQPGDIGFMMADERRMTVLLSSLKRGKGEESIVGTARDVELGHMLGEGRRANSARDRVSSDGGGGKTKGKGDEKADGGSDDLPAFPFRMRRSGSMLPSTPRDEQDVWVGGQAATTMDTIDRVDEGTRGHIVVAGWRSQLQQFVFALRSIQKHHNAAPELVFVDTCHPSVKELEEFGLYDNVKYLRGSILDRRTQTALRLDSARCVVIFPKDQGAEGSKSELNMDQTVITIRHALSTYETLKVLVCVTSASSLQFLDVHLGVWEDDEDDELFRWQPSFTDGTAVTPATGQLLSLACFDPSAYYCLQKLLLCGCANQAASLSLRDVPGNVDDDAQTYGEMALKLLRLDRECALGLYRRALDEDCRHFVAINPPEDTPLRPTDMVYVLSPITTQKS